MFQMTDHLRYLKNEVSVIKGIISASIGMTWMPDTIESSLVNQNITGWLVQAYAWKVTNKLNHGLYLINKLDIHDLENRVIKFKV